MWEQGIVGKHSDSFTASNFFFYNKKKTFASEVEKNTGI